MILYWIFPLPSLGLLAPVVPFNLPDVGEAIMTVELKEWYDTA
jgi:hypothetical protein